MRRLGLVLASLLVACGSDGSGAGASGASGGSGGAGGAGGLGGAGAGGASGGAGGASGGAGGASGGAGGASGGAGGMLPACIAVPDCSAAPPDPGPSVSWNHFLSSVTAASGSPNHRGRDLFLNPGDEQWVLAKFAYGVLDDDIQDEVVDVWLYRDCSSWELLGSALTTADGQHPTVEGVEDTGGRVYFQIPANEKLGVGRHRVHLVVRGDLTSTDQYIEVVPKGTPVFVSDVDGTLTTYETEEFVTLLTGALPDMNPDAAAALNLLAGHGYRPFYLTARPEYLGQRTRDFLDQNGFSPGIVHTTLSLGGALGGSASTYKIDELAWLASKGMVPFYAFGNTSTDADAYAASGVAPDDHRVFFQFDDTAHGGRRIEAYTELLGELGALPDACE